MTATELQEQLCQEIKNIFKGVFFCDSMGQRVPMNVFEQGLPIRESEEEPDPIPYIIVRIETGTTRSGVDPQEVFVTLLIGCFDGSKENNGHKIVLGAIQKIHERFEKEPMLANQFMFQDPFEWVLSDEETYPYYFGAASMVFKTAAIRKEDRFA